MWDNVVVPGTRLLPRSNCAVATTASPLSRQKRAAAPHLAAVSCMSCMSAMHSAPGRCCTVVQHTAQPCKLKRRCCWLLSFGFLDHLAAGSACPACPARAACRAAAAARGTKKPPPHKTCARINTSVLSLSINFHVVSTCRVSAGGAVVTCDHVKLCVVVDRRVAAWRSRDVPHLSKMQTWGRTSCKILTNGCSLRDGPPVCSGSITEGRRTAHSNGNGCWTLTLA